MDRKTEIMRRAIELSRQGMEAGDGGPFGSVLVKEGKVVGEGWNRVITSTDPTAHAEVEAIRDACKRLGTFKLDGCDLYASSQPCPMCLAAAYWARVDRIYYANTAEDAAAIGFDDHFFYTQLGLLPGDRTIPEERLLPEEALAVFQAYLAKPGRVPY